jgi:DNA-binding PadR family transcriptional regulator
MAREASGIERSVLAAILKLSGDAYAAAIQAHLNPLSLGAVYFTLDALEDQGLVTSGLTEPTPGRGGRAKRCYQLEALGERAMEESEAFGTGLLQRLGHAGKRWRGATG